MKKFFSIYSGICYEILDDEVDLLDNGQIPLNEFPDTNCKHCTGKGYTVKDSNTNVYIMCKCMVKKTPIDLTKHFIENVRLHSQK